MSATPLLTTLWPVRGVRFGCDVGTSRPTIGDAGDNAASRRSYGGEPMGTVIRIKPHHVVDIISALGRGQTTFQPHPYGHGVHTVAPCLLCDHDVLLEIELGADDICRPCKHNINGLCNDTIDTSFRPRAPSSKRLYNLLIDRRWCQQLGLVAGDRITPRQFCLLVRECVGKLTAIYCENPSERTAAQARDLLAGIEKFLTKQ